MATIVMRLNVAYTEVCDGSLEEQHKWCVKVAGEAAKALDVDPESVALEAVNEAMGPKQDAAVEVDLRVHLPGRAAAQAESGALREKVNKFTLQWVTGACGVTDGDFNTDVLVWYDFGTSNELERVKQELNVANVLSTIKRPKQSTEKGMSITKSELRQYRVGLDDRLGVLSKLLHGGVIDSGPAASLTRTLLRP